MKKRKIDVVWSSNPNYTYQYQENIEAKTLPPAQQDLRVRPDRKNRAGKTVTIVSGFKGGNKDLEVLMKKLKTLCACGGTCKEGEIQLQGNFVNKAADFLKREGYKVKISGV